MKLVHVFKGIRLSQPDVKTDREESPGDRTGTNLTAHEDTCKAETGTVDMCKFL